MAIKEKEQRTRACLAKIYKYIDGMIQNINYFS